MLKNGEFIKEEPPEIGRLYIPRYAEDNYTPEEWFAQDVVLGKSSKEFTLSKLLSLILRV